MEQGVFLKGVRHNRASYDTAAVKLKEQQGGHVWRGNTGGNGIVILGGGVYSVCAWS